jgi:putative salt-induced outer membrane protein YdiY
MSNKNYIFNLLTYHQDKFENIGSRIADVVGRGRHLIKNKKHSLSNELGLGLRQTKYVDATKNSKEMAGYFALNYERPLTNNTLFKEKFSILAGSDNIFTQLDISAKVKMTKRLSLSVNYSLEYNSKVQSGFKKLGKKMGITLLSEF